MTISRNIHGAWVVSDIVNGRLIVRRYYYYTKREAVAAFKRETKV